MRALRPFAIPFYVFFLQFTSFAFSAEVDHYLGTPYELRDSTREVNQSFSKLIQSSLNKINNGRRRAKLSCHKVALKIGKFFFNGH